jgi:hypothetical protein
MEREYSKSWENRGAYRDFVVNAESKVILGRPRLGFSSKSMGCRGMN